MRRFLVAMSALLVLLAPQAAHAQSAGGCQFVLGFQTLHDLDPADVGDCTDNQAFAANGDALQHTTKGLLGWIKADNTTKFTNGYQTWLNSSKGLVSRLNTQRFAFEHDLGILAGVWGCDTILAKIGLDGSGMYLNFRQPWMNGLKAANPDPAAMVGNTWDVFTFQISGDPPVEQLDPSGPKATGPTPYYRHVVFNSASLKMKGGSGAGSLPGRFAVDFWWNGNRTLNWYGSAAKLVPLGTVGDVPSCGWDPGKAPA